MVQYTLNQDTALATGTGSIFFILDLKTWILSSSQYAKMQVITAHLTTVKTQKQYRITFIEVCTLF